MTKMNDLAITAARMHLRYDDILDTETKMDYKSFTKDNLEFGRLWISTDAMARAAFMELYGTKGGSKI